MARQGLGLAAAHFSLEPITDDAAEVKARTLCGILGVPTLYVVRVGEAFAEVAHAANRRFYFILTTRLMVRLADAVASLRAIDAVARHPIIRPLIGFDKQEIVDRAKAIGTYDVSKGPEICDLLGPPRPATHARMDQILGEEAKLSVDRLVAECLEGVEPERFKPNRAAGSLPTSPETAR